MSRSHTGLAAVTGVVVIMLLLGFVTLTGMSASLAWSQSSGYGSGPGICQTATPTPGVPGATPHCLTKNFLSLLQVSLFSIRRVSKKCLFLGIMGTSVSKGKLEDALFTALLQVAGWIV